MVHYLATYLDKLHQTPEKRFFSSWLTSPPLPAVAAWLKGREDALLDAFWIALVGVETLLVLGVVMRRIVGRLGGSGGSSRSSSSTSAGAARRENPKAKTT